ncbi:MAG TPA: desulfoferrodoxin [Phycisphaerae bacterium]|nr:desulfoferrodoxin [Phycisphaerae bacterium]
MATERRQVYKCEVCGIVCEILDGGAGQCICCDQPMTLLSEKTADEGKEKHVPVVEASDAGVKVKVGSVPHPMTEKHFIQWIEVLADGQECRQQLRPGEAPEASFCTKARKVTARGYCNLHGLWKSQQ